MMTIEESIKLINDGLKRLDPKDVKFQLLVLIKNHFSVHCVAEKSGILREHLYKILDPDKTRISPSSRSSQSTSLSVYMKIVKSLGFRFVLVEEFETEINAEEHLPKFQGGIRQEYPVIADFLDPENEGIAYILPNSRKEVGWRCTFGAAHTWQETPSKMIIRFKANIAELRTFDKDSLRSIICPICRENLYGIERKV